MTTLTLPIAPVADTVCKLSSTVASGSVILPVSSSPTISALEDDLPVAAGVANVPTTVPSVSDTFWFNSAYCKCSCYTE